MRAIGKSIPRHFLCVLDVHRKYLMEAPELHKIVPARQPCATDVPYNWEIDSQIIKESVCVCVIILGPIVFYYLSAPRKSQSQSLRFQIWAIPPVRLGLSGRNSGRIPERPRKRSPSVSWNSPREYGWDPPNPIIQGI